MWPNSGRKINSIDHPKQENGFMVYPRNPKSKYMHEYVLFGKYYQFYDWLNAQANKLYVEGHSLLELRP